MFKSEVMNKVNLYILKDDLKKVTQVLYDLKLVQFFKVKEHKLEKFQEEDVKTDPSRLLKIKSAISFLDEHYTHSENKKISENPLDDTFKLREKLDNLSKEVISLEDSAKREKILVSLNVTEKELEDPLTKIGFVAKKKSSVLNKLKRRNIKFRQHTFENRTYFIAKAKEIPFEYKEFYLPKKSKKDSHLKLIEKKFELNKLKSEIVEFANNHLESLKKEESKESKDLSLVEVKHNFATSKNITVLSGFIPENELKALESSLGEVLADRYELESKKVKKDAPIKLKNSGSIQNFEGLLKMYSLPKYGEIDPTFFMFITFPIFFGFILGDVFYGLISLIFFTFLRYKIPKIKGFLSVLQLSSISSMIFGVIYGEFMGFEWHGHFLGIPYGFFSRSHHPEALLMYAILFGVIHINLGLIIGFFNDLSHGIKEAITHKLAWVIMQLGVGIGAFGFYLANDIVLYMGVLLFIVSLVLLVMGHGVMGIMEVPGIFGNILSYARLMAVGLSSIIIAELVNEFTHTFFSMGVLGIVGGILIFTIGHIFNIILGNFESFLHPLRLHYVEHFSKYYEGGGEEFIPFGTRVEED